MEKKSVESYPEYFKILDGRKMITPAFGVICLMFVAMIIFVLYEHNFEIEKISYWRGLYLLLLFFMITYPMIFMNNTEKIINKSEIKSVSWTKKLMKYSVVIHYGKKKRLIDGLTEQEAKDIVKFLMSNK